MDIVFQYFKLAIKRNINLGCPAHTTTVTMHPKVKTHLSATEREPMGYYVDSKDLENLLWRQGVFGHLHAVDLVQSL